MRCENAPASIQDNVRADCMVGSVKGIQQKVLGEVEVQPEEPLGRKVSQICIQKIAINGVMVEIERCHKSAFLCRLNEEIQQYEENS